MKTKRLLCLAGALLLVCAGCAGADRDDPDSAAPPPAAGQTESAPAGEDPAAPEEDGAESPAPVDVDLTVLSSTMVYAEVSNMMLTPEDYLGKTVRLTGTFTVYQEPETDRIYCGAIVQDATACCAQGFDIIMPDDAVYPRDYPPSGSEVTVVGELQADRTMEEYGLVFLRLENVTFERTARAVE